MNGIEIKEEEILKILKPLKNKWRICTVLAYAAGLLLFLGVCLIPLWVKDSVGILLDLSPAAIRGIGFAFIALFIAAIITVPALIFLSNKQWKAYVAAYKNLIPRKVMEATLENGQCYFNGGYARKDFEALDLLKIDGRHTYTSEDLITGFYKGIGFKRADIKITHEVGGRNKHTVVDVDGRILEISFPKQIEGRVKIVKKNDLYTLLKGDTITMEDVDFNRRFDVFAKDPHSAFYLLTPHFMEYIKELHDIDERMYIGFDGKKVCILQSGHGGIFEPPKEKLDVWEEVRKCEAELKEIGEMINIITQ